MSDSDVKRILNYAHMPTVEFALTLVNLTDLERNILVITELKGKTNEYTSEMLNCSVKTIYTHKKKALKKCGKAWEKEKAIKMILEG